MGTVDAHQKSRIILWWSYWAAKSRVIAESKCAAEKVSDCAVLNTHGLPVESLRWWRAHIPLKHVHASARPLWGGGGSEHWGFRNPTGQTQENELLLHALMILPHASSWFIMTKQIHQFINITVKLQLNVAITYVCTVCIDMCIYKNICIYT